MDFNKLSIKNAILISISLLLIISFLLIVNVQVFNFDVNIASFISHLIVLIIVLVLNTKYVKRPKKILPNKTYHLLSALIAFLIAVIYIFIDEKADLEVNVYEVISSVFLAAIFEEITYRNIILKGLLNKYSTLTAVVVSSVLFIISHFDVFLQPDKILMLLVISGFSCWLFIKTRNITNCIILHSSYNLGVIFIPKAILLIQ